MDVEVNSNICHSVWIKNFLFTCHNNKISILIDWLQNSNWSATELFLCSTCFWWYTNMFTNSYIQVSHTFTIKAWKWTEETSLNKNMALPNYLWFFFYFLLYLIMWFLVWNIFDHKICFQMYSFHLHRIPSTVC